MSSPHTSNLNRQSYFVSCKSLLPSVAASHLWIPMTWNMTSAGTASTNCTVNCEDEVQRKKTDGPWSFNIDYMSILIELNKI